MTLPAEFSFNQSSLQDYLDCQRRFELRYLLRLSWPAVEIEPALENERFIRRGSTFHRLVHQHLIGIPEARLAPYADEPELSQWWQAYLKQAGKLLGDCLSKYPETMLTTELAGQILVAKFNMLSLQEDGTLRIIDWKTSRFPPQRRHLAERMQTHIYPFVLVRAGASLLGREIQPVQVQMVYWYTSQPEQPLIFAYDQAQYARDEQLLSSLISGIASQANGEFPLTSYEERCRLCTYRSLCQRGVQAGEIEEFSGDSEPGTTGLLDDLDFDQIGEIEY